MSVVLWSARPTADRRVTWAELFFDLVFVAAVAQVGFPLATDYGFSALGRYVLLLLVIWWAWTGYALYATRFDADDGADRALTLLQMVAVIFMAANAEEGLDSTSSAGFAAAYASMRLILAVRYLRATVVPVARGLAVEFAAGCGVAALVWLASAIVEPPARYVLWAIALAIDVGAALAASRHTWILPPHAAHLPERFGLFTLILLGESIVAVMTGIQSQPVWTPQAAASALTGIAVVFAVWWAYFDLAGATAHRHVRSRRDARTLDAWTFAHLPLYVGIALTGVGFEHAVHSGGLGALHAEEAWLLAGAMAAAAGALVILRAVSEAVPRPQITRTAASAPAR